MSTVQRVAPDRRADVLAEALRAVEERREELHGGGVLEGREAARGGGVEGGAEELAVLAVARARGGERDAVVPAYAVGWSVR